MPKPGFTGTHLIVQIKQSQKVCPPQFRDGIWSLKKFISFAKEKAIA